jgi:signal peptidase I
MEPTIKKGQLIFVREVNGAKDHDFKHGDLVAIRSPGPREAIYVRRVVGLAGDQIEVRSDSLLVNGHSISEPYATWTEKALQEVEPNYKERLAELFQVGPLPIPTGTIYVMCDNRLDRPDSRTFGALPIKNVVGFVSARN